MKGVSCAGGCDISSPVFWLTSYHWLSPTPYYPTAEIDVVENTIYNNIYQINSGNPVTGYGNSNNQINIPGPPDFTQYHTYGVLWVTAANNGGTGYVKFYFDNTLYTTVQYSQNGAPNPSTCRNPVSGNVTCPNGTFYNIDSDKLFLLLSPANNNPNGNKNATFRNMHVWQLPASR